MSNELAVSESQQLAVQVDVANKYPRQLDSFVDNVLTVVKRDPDFAKSCIYCVPVGKQNDQSQKFAMGPGVRLSEEMQKYWKHLRVAVNCEITADKIIVNGLIMDCESNNAETLVDQVSCKGWSDRRVNLKAKAMQSIMKRDLRMSIIGKSYADELMTKIIDHLLQDKVSVWEYCKQKYAEIGVDEKTLLSYFKAISPEALTSKNIYQAIGIYNFLQEMGEGPEYVFGSDRMKSSKPAVRPQDVSEKKESPRQKKQQPSKKNSPPPQKEDAGAAEVMDAEAFEEEVKDLAKSISMTDKGIDMNLKAQFKINSLSEVPAEKQSMVIDYFTALSEEQAGA